MKLRRLSAVAVAATLALAPTAAHAGTTNTIALGEGEDADVRIDEAVTITGQTSACGDVGGTATLTLTYVTNADASASADTPATVSSTGAYSAEVAIPDDAQPGTEASVVANVTCGQPSSGTARQGGNSGSNTLILNLLAAVGTLSVSPTSGQPGTQVTLNGTNCLGGDVLVLFADGAAEDEDDLVEVPVTLTGSTFSGVFTIPAGAAPGVGAFLAECPGTDYPEVRFDVLAANQPAPTAPPAVPVPGVVTVTG